MSILSSIGGFFGRIGQALYGILDTFWNVAGDLFWRIVGIPGFILDLFGVNWPPKKLRVTIRILKDLNGQSLDPARDLAAESTEAFDLANRIFVREANVRLVPAGGSPLITVLETVPPAGALNPECGSSGFFDTFGEAGEYFQNFRAINLGKLLLNYASPITVYIVNDIPDNAGCSNGITSEYILVDLQGLVITDATGGTNPSATMAHEIGHACGLLHRSNTENLMTTAAQGRTNTTLTNWQQSAVRGSRHVTVI